jgi:hypothetical protein
MMRHDEANRGAAIGLPGVEASMQGLRQNANRVFLAAITLWALAMIVPDLYRLIQPLGSFGFYSNNDGLVTDVRGPFPDESSSPAFQAGLRVGDRLDLARMRCIPINTRTCATAMAALGGMRLVSDRQRAELVLTATPERPARQVDIVAKPRPYNWWTVAVLALDQVAGILVILAAAWLVWTRPGPMTWGFFLYVIWFNPGQSAQYYALLQQYSPVALLTQHVFGAIAQGIGFAGFIWFALRAPTDETTRRWRPVERALPVVAVLLSILLALSHANLFGYPTEMVTRAGILSAVAVAACAFVILLVRRNELQPPDYQRLRWVIWGCLIGLTALAVADAGTLTTMLDFLWQGDPPPEHVWGLVYLVNGVLCLFVSEAIRRPYVVTVSIPLRRVTILGLLVSIPMLFLHHQIDHVREVTDEAITLPSWTWVVIAAFMLFLISRLHEWIVHHADRLFNHSIAAAGQRLGRAILSAGDFAEIDANLVQGVRNALDLASASVFRHEDQRFRRSAADQGWDDTATRTLDPDDPMLAPVRTGLPYGISAEAAARNRLPHGLGRPILAVPVGDRLRCVALALYGPHAAGTDLSLDERAMLANLADLAASAYMKLDHDRLSRRVAVLETELRTRNAKLAATAPPSQPAS